MRILGAGKTHISGKSHSEDQKVVIVGQFHAWDNYTSIEIKLS